LKEESDVFMYAVKIYYTDTDGDNELEVELVHNKREALRTKEAYERSSYGLRKVVPDLSYLNKIEIEKQSNFNYKRLRRKPQTDKVALV